MGGEVSALHLVAVRRRATQSNGFQLLQSSARTGNVRRVDAPVLRAILESGAVWEDPSEDLLFMLLTDIEEGEETFVIVERPSDESGQTYAQVIRGDGGEWVLERRDGDSDHHCRTTFDGLREAHETLTACVRAS